MKITGVGADLFHEDGQTVITNLTLTHRSSTTVPIEDILVP